MNRLHGQSSCDHQKLPKGKFRSLPTGETLMIQSFIAVELQLRVSSFLIALNSSFTHSEKDNPKIQRQKQTRQTQHTSADLDVP